MKSNTLFYPLLIVLAAVSLATTGCKHKPMNVTNLPNQPAAVGSADGSGLANGSTVGVTGSGPIVTGGGPIPVSDKLDPSKYDAHPEAFAANTVHFPFDSSAIKSTEEVNVEAVANALKSAPANAVQIEGHCDERGTEEYNRALGERRAEALRQELAKLGISSDHVCTISFGKDKPVDTGHTEAAFSKNRRGVFILLTPKAGVPGV